MGMESFKIIKKGNKFFVNNDFWGNMMIYGVKTAKPYIKRLGEKFYLTNAMKSQLKALV